MAFKFVALCALFAVANAGYAPVTTYAAAAPVVTKVVNPSVDAVASTQQNVVRSFGGTVSHYSKSVQTPYSSVHKEDTRINNNVYTPAVAKTVTYAAPAVAKTVTYAAPAVAKTVYSHEAPAVYSHAAPAVYSHAAPAVYAAPAVAKTVYSHEAPAVYSHAAPAVYSHAAPAVYAAPAVAKTVSYAAPAATTTYNHGPDATTYSHNAPGVTGYGSSQTVHYSPANMVSHMSFDGFGTHWGF
ncbi:pupal cuticle protein G1A-like [Stomoxys calcitrans]|uniref:pupal cuticle protein G1A-like n=1 Tax=Stomoxys calcitrans TaxID=35570 RepID=UPI0027E24A78|nr:pupal cuticle protein G1A-like [Stomoxys calcitrans]